MSFTWQRQLFAGFPQIFRLTKIGDKKLLNLKRKNTYGKKQNDRFTKSSNMVSLVLLNALMCG